MKYKGDKRYKRGAYRPYQTVDETLWRLMFAPPRSNKPLSATHRQVYIR